MTSKFVLINVCLLQFLVQNSESKSNKNFTTVSTKPTYKYSFVNELLNYCLNESKVTIFFTTKSFEAEVLLKYLYERHNIIYLVSDTANYFKKHIRNRHVYFLNDTNIKPANTPVTSVILSISSPILLKKTLEELRNSVWWNHEAYFIIINSNISNSCNMADIFLQIAWTYKILYSLYFCKNYNNDLLIYTYNPYSDLAPMFWTKVQTNASSNLQWTLFRSSWHTIADWQIDNCNIVCHSLFFDKTKNLNGYNLKVAYGSWNSSDCFMKAKSGFEKFVGFEPKLISIVLHYINATVTVKSFSSVNFFENDSKLIGIGKDIISGIPELTINMYFLRDYWKLQASSAFFSASLKIITLKTPISNLQNLNLTASFKMWTYLIIGGITFIFFLKIILNSSMALAALEFFRILVQASTLQMPYNLLGRMLFIIFILVNFIFSSYIQSFLLAETTTNNQFDAIDTIDELRMSNRSIYGYLTHKNLIQQEEIQKRIQALPVPNITFEQLVRSKNTACISTKEYLGSSFQNWSLIHISKESLSDRILTYTFTEDSPFLQTFGVTLLKLSEAGIIQYILRREKMIYIRNEFSEDASSTMINMSNLMVIFRILITSWLLGILTLCCEVLIYKFKNLKDFDYI